MKTAAHFLVFLLITLSNSSFGFLGFGGDSWNEEVLLHDGSKLIVKRSQTYGGRHEIGQSPPIKEHIVTFVLPSSGKSITWASEYGEDIGRTNFDLLAVHLLNDTPYIVASPNLCLSYNKWGRPNPPYVFFKYNGNRWDRIPVEQLPSEFKTINVAVPLGRRNVEAMVRLGLVSLEQIAELNRGLTQPEYKAILRESIPDAGGMSCGEMIPTSDGGFTGIGWFKKQPNLEGCIKYCAREKVDARHCPCGRLFPNK